jgi:hypothetical protein
MTRDELEALEAIRQLKARYFRYVDTKRWDRFAELFSEDAVLHVPVNRAEPLRGATAIAERVRLGLSEMITVHHGHTPEIELLDADRARAIWPLYDRLSSVSNELTADPAAPGFGPRYEGVGHYVEEYARGDDGQWRITQIELRRLHLEIERHLRDVASFDAPAASAAV